MDFYEVLDQILALLRHRGRVTYRALQTQFQLDDEQRDFIIGYSLAQRLLLVVYLERGVRTRIISARPATRQERKLYEEA